VGTEVGGSVVGAARTVVGGAVVGAGAFVIGGAVTLDVGTVVPTVAVVEGPDGSTPEASDDGVSADSVVVGDGGRRKVRGARPVAARTWARMCAAHGGSCRRCATCTLISKEPPSNVSDVSKTANVRRGRPNESRPLAFRGKGLDRPGVRISSYRHSGFEAIVKTSGTG
jgi:hypothetical protein